MLNKKKHQSILLRILKDIYKNKKISNYLVFKGGTCSYLIYDLDRFSTDLDFSLLDISKLKIVFEELQIIVPKYGKIKDKWIKRNTILFEISYGESDHNIKIEISTRKINIIPEIKNYLGINLLVMNKGDIFANKLLALRNRENIANRDIYDSYFFFNKSYPINESIIKEESKKNLKEFLIDLKDFIDKNVNKKMILDGLGEILDEKQKKWVKENLVSELIWEIDLFLSNN